MIRGENLITQPKNFLGAEFRQHDRTAYTTLEDQFNSVVKYVLPILQLSVLFPRILRDVRKTIRLPKLTLPLKMKTIF